jgi:hypothetical protein
MEKYRPMVFELPLNLAVLFEAFFPYHLNLVLLLSGIAWRSFDDALLIVLQLCLELDNLDKKVHVCVFVSLVKIT